MQPDDIIFEEFTLRPKGMGGWDVYRTADNAHMNKGRARVFYDVHEAKMFVVNELRNRSVA